MPSVLDLFGELGLKTDKFDRTLQGSLAQMKAADAQLNKVISSSNKLGDTSATVARRYEKLSDGIATQKHRLLEAAAAFQRGDVNAKKFQSTIDSVSNSVDGLNSRVKDAKARVTELNETGRTHFQNQIQGAIGSGNPVTGSRDLFSSLSRFQKTQLSFQLNDVISGLAMGQSPFQILAQQGGQILQIFQQTAGHMKNTADAAGTAATAATKFAASSQLAAVAQGQTAVAAQATAVATTESSAAMTVAGYSIVGVGAALAAGLVAILSAKKASEDILKTAQDRLKAEEAVVGALNKQYLAAKALKDELADIGKKGQFDRFLKSAGDGSAGIGYLQRTQANLQQQYDANLRSVTTEINRRAAEADILGYTGNVRSDFINGATPAGMADTQKGLNDQIKGIAAKIEELRTSEPTSIEWYSNAQKQQLENLKKDIDVAVKAQKEARENAKQIIEQQNKEETALLQNKFKVQEAELKLHLQTSAASQAESIVATTALQTREIDAQIAGAKRYYNAVIANAADATDKQQAESNKRIAIANLEAQKQIAAIEKVRQLRSENLQQFNQSLKALDLRTQAKEFSQGFKNENDPGFSERAHFYASNVSRIGDAPGTFQKNYEYFLAEEKAGASKRGLSSKLSAIGGPQASAALEAERQRSIISVTAGADPAQLTSGQNTIASRARQQEADRIEKERDATTKELIKAIQEGALIRFVDVPDNVRVTRRPRAADVQDRVGN